MKEFLKKLTSRKFLISVAGFISGLAMVFTNTDNSNMQIIGGILSGLSVIIYTIIEGINDGKSLNVIELAKTVKELVEDVEKLLNSGDDKNEK